MARREEYSSAGNVLGAAILGALAGAAAVFLSDRSNREMVKEKANRLMADGKDKLSEVEDKARSQAAKKLDQAKRTVEKK